MIDTVATRRSLRTETHSAAPRSSAASHILIPVTLADADRAAIRSGLQMAAATGAKVTIVQVGLLPVEFTSRNWLDSIDRLHRSLDGDGHVDGATLARAAADRLRGFVDSAGVSSLLAEVEATLLTRPGDVCEEVLRLARTESPDLVILSGDLLQCWIPGVRSRLHRKLQQMGKRILAVWPESAAVRLAWDQAQPSLAY